MVVVFVAGIEEAVEVVVVAAVWRQKQAAGCTTTCCAKTKATTWTGASSIATAACCSQSLEPKAGPIAGNFECIANMSSRLDAPHLNWVAGQCLLKTAGIPPVPPSKKQGASNFLAQHFSRTMKTVAFRSKKSTSS